jgi:hypothetical protein
MSSSEVTLAHTSCPAMAAAAPPPAQQRSGGMMAGLGGMMAQGAPKHSQNPHITPHLCQIQPLQLFSATRIAVAVPAALRIRLLVHSDSVSLLMCS